MHVDLRGRELRGFATAVAIRASGTDRDARLSYRPVSQRSATQEVASTASPKLSRVACDLGGKVLRPRVRFAIAPL
jgi:hypothetical protein